MAKTITTKKIDINGTVYTLQMVSAKWLLDHTDKCKNEDGILQNSQYVEGLIENVVISPKVKIDDFTGRMKELQTLNKEIDKFVSGDDVTVKNVESPENNSTSN
jgi:hypothetical protein